MNYIETDEMSIENWLELLSSRTKSMKFVDYMFPNEAAARDYLSTITTRTEDEVKKLLNKFLIPSGLLGTDSAHHRWMAHLKKEDRSRYESLMKRMYWHRLWNYYESVGNSLHPWEGITWVIDLLPFHPRRALDALDA
jgi:restriction system protein